MQNEELRRAYNPTEHELLEDCLALLVRVNKRIGIPEYAPMTFIEEDCYYMEIMVRRVLHGLQAVPT